MGDLIPAEGGTLFTRGGPNMPDTRGKSMVAVHLDKLQKQKEERGMERLRLLMPQLSAATHAVALQECNWEEDTAVAMLRLFVANKADDLKILAKEKKKHHKKLIEQMNKAAQDNSDKSSGSDSSESSSGKESGSDSDVTDDSRENNRSRRDRRKDGSSRKRSRSSKDRHNKERKRSRKEKDSKKRSKSSSSRRRDKEKKRDLYKKEKREKQQQPSSKSRRSKDKDDKGKVLGTREYEYGKFGVIRETDYYTKRSEFTLWALEVKKSDVEAMSRFEEKELFKSYMEDYNTATLPHNKFYDLEAWERETAGTGGGGERMVFNDEAERKKELLAERQREHAERLRAAYEELQTTDKAQAMREQELLRSKMSLAYRLGDQKEAARLAERLKPDEPK